jgi:hypothetical protein
LTAAENITAVRSVAVLIGPSTAIVVASPPAAAPLPKVKVRLEALPLVSMAKHTMAEAVRITTDPMAAAAVRRFRVCDGGYGSRAKGNGDSKTERVFAHSFFFLKPACNSLPKRTAVVNQCGLCWRAPQANGLSAAVPACSCRQLIEQRLRFLQIERVEALGEPAVDRSEKIAGLILLALIAPEPGAQLIELRLGVLQNRCIETFGEPPIVRCKQIAGLGILALIPPQAG